MVDQQYEARVARNERFFKRVNSEIAELKLDLAGRDGEDVVTVLCECGQAECADDVVVSISDLEMSRKRSDWLVVRPYHVGTPLETVVARDNEYWIVEHANADVEEEQRDEPMTGDYVDRTLISALRSIVAGHKRVHAHESAITGREHAMNRSLEDARRAAERFERATTHYRNLMRHRIGNPLAVICGMAHTLRFVDGISDDRRAAMLDAIVEQAERLKAVSTEPHALDPIEVPIDPWRPSEGARR